MSKAVLTIEDSAQEGSVNIHYSFEPDLDETSPAHHLMSRVLCGLQEMIKDQIKENLCA